MDLPYFPISLPLDKHCGAIYLGRAFGNFSDDLSLSKTTHKNLLPLAVTHLTCLPSKIMKADWRKAGYRCIYHDDFRIKGQYLWCNFSFHINLRCIASPTCTVCALVGKSTSLSFSLLLSFWLHLTTSGILVPQLGIKLVPPALGLQSLNHWTTRKIPTQSFDRTWKKKKGPRETESNLLIKTQWDSTFSRANGSLMLKHIVRTSLVSQWLRIPCQCREHRFEPWLN